MIFMYVMYVQIAENGQKPTLSKLYFFWFLFTPDLKIYLLCEISSFNYIGDRSKNVASQNYPSCSLNMKSLNYFLMCFVVQAQKPDLVVEHYSLPLRHFSYRLIKWGPM